MGLSYQCYRYCHYCYYYCDYYDYLNYLHYCNFLTVVALVVFIILARVIVNCLLYLSTFIVVLLHTIITATSSAVAVVVF